jgi:hypothetical protein
MEAPVDIVPSVEAPLAQHDDAAPKAALTPPTSEDNDKRDERMSSELSEIDSDDGEDIEPDHYFEGGKIPVFKPVRCRAARNFTVDILYLRDDVVGNMRHEKWLLTFCCADYGPVPQLQKIHRQDRQARDEVWHRQSHPPG